MKRISLRPRMNFERKLLVTLLLLTIGITVAISVTNLLRTARIRERVGSENVERALEESRNMARGLVDEERMRAFELTGETLDLLDPVRSDDSVRAGSVIASRFGNEESGLFDLYEWSGAEWKMLISFRAGPVPEDVLLPLPDDTVDDSVLDTGDDRLAAALRHSGARGDAPVRIAVGGLVLPDELVRQTGTIVEGYGYYRQLAIYEEYSRPEFLVVSGLILLAAVLGAFLVARLLARSLTKPIHALVAGTEKVRDGDLDVRVEKSSSDELGILVDSFNRMTGDLRTGRERLVRAERVATWAEAAKRIAHEIKNPLTPITVSLHRIQKRAESLDAEERRALDDLLEPIIEEVENLKALAEEFSQFSRLRAPKMEAVDVKDLLEKVGALYGGGTGAAIRIETASGTPPARGDRELLWRALSNLVKNGVEAMEGEGNLVLRAGPAPGGMVEISVSDEGPGIAPETRKKIFTPYFTTKEGGTGLGLALVERIIHDHRGSVTAHGGAEKGTTFRILLPRM